MSYARRSTTGGQSKPEGWPAWLGEEPADAPQLKARSMCFALTPEMPDILRGRRLDPSKKHIYRVWLISSGLCLHPLIVRSPSTRQLIVNELCNCLALPKQSTEVVDNLVEKDDVDREL
jgi:hypothetical protein